MSDLHPTVCLSDYVKDIKVASSIWMKESGKFPAFEGWQDKYGAFTYSIKEKGIIINYIKNQSVGLLWRKSIIRQKVFTMSSRDY